MLIRFEIENWLSFRSRSELSLVATRERQHGERLSRPHGFEARILPVTAIYGANASGKSNLFKALGFAREMVVTGTAPDARIGVAPFRLGRGSQDQPTRFCFDIVVNEMSYEFGFIVDATTVHEEWLVETSGARDRELYRRRNGGITFHKSLDKSLDEEKFLDFAFRGTRDNQLFLTNSVSQKVNVFKPIHDWFRHSLVLIAPESRFGAMDLYLGEQGPRSRAMDAMLDQLDTGIVHLAGETLEIDSLPLSDIEKRHLVELIDGGNALRIVTSAQEHILIRRDKGEIVAKRMVTQHRHEDGSLTRFDMAQESDGTQRIIDLLPAFMDLSRAATPRVYVIDELDRSLHTLLTRRLLEGFLAASGPEARRQLVFTTHDVHLMDQDLFRRDEMWVVERNRAGESSLIPFSDYKDVRYDKDIRKSYLQGRLGGVPRMLLTDVMAVREPGVDEVE